MNCPVIIALLLGMVGGLGPMPAAAGECPYPLTPLAPVLAKHPDVVGVTESQVKRYADEITLRTSIHFNDDSTAQVEQSGCHGIVYSIRIEYPLADKAAQVKAAQRLYWLLEPTRVVATWRKHGLDYRNQFETWLSQAANTPNKAIGLDALISWPVDNGDVLSASVTVASSPAVPPLRRAAVLWIGIGPEVDVGEGD